MPIFQSMIYRLNDIFNDRRIDDLDANLFAPGNDLADIGDRLGIPPNDRGLVLLRAIPPSLREALRAMVYENLSRGTRVPMSCVWLPGYDHEITLSEAPSTVDSPGGITVIFRTRYPRDEHPSSIGR